MLRNSLSSGHTRDASLLAVGLALLVLVGLQAMAVGGAANGVEPAPNVETTIQQDADLQLTASASEGDEDGTVTIDVTLENAGPERSDAPVVDLRSMPEEWEVVEQTSEGAAYRQSTDEWLWVSLAPGGAVNLTATIDVSDASQTHELKILAHDVDDNHDEVTLEVDPGGGLPTSLLAVTGAVMLLLLAGAVVVAIGAGIYLYRGWDDESVTSGGDDEPTAPGGDDEAE